MISGFRFSPVTGVILSSEQLKSFDKFFPPRQVHIPVYLLFLPILCHGSDEKFQDKILAELSRLEDKTTKLALEAEELKVEMVEKDKRIKFLEEKLADKEQENSDSRHKKGME